MLSTTHVRYVSLAWKLVQHRLDVLLVVTAAFLSVLVEGGDETCHGMQAEKEESDNDGVFLTSLRQLFTVVVVELSYFI